MESVLVAPGDIDQYRIRDGFEISITAKSVDGTDIMDKPSRLWEQLISFGVSMKLLNALEVKVDTAYGPFGERDAGSC
ncbi:hypothetical protein MPH_05992 [Macrophomina phaseolina MS6]|uniref:Uncharacterized protein n=1 Tax=Macrophomina phaseolina (strain MS6) TaxID=1126212 RepID=K2S2Q2_MACPH|nr:hypothetical protein MPH_05992 [Macrophomina phaseolina MS6]